MSYYDLKMKCPAVYCSGGDISTWSHNNCGGRIQIAETANLRCNRCYNCHVFWDWRFSCGSHPGEYRKPDFDAVLNTFIALSSYYSSAGVTWLNSLTTNLIATKRD